MYLGVIQEKMIDSGKSLQKTREKFGFEMHTSMYMHFQ